MSGCPSDEQIAELVEGLLEEADRTAVASHVAGCPACSTLAAEVAASREAPASRGSGVLARGTRVGRYSIIDLLGAGGMGAVYAAHDPALDRRVALKLIHAKVAGPELEERLLREAKAMARLSDPDVISVYDAGRDGNQLFIAMELVLGGTLRDWLAERPRAWREVLSVYMRAGRGLARAHASGLVHRDFKPDNVLVGRDGRVRVTDFGLARDAGAEAAPRSAVEAEARDLALETTAHAPLTQTGALLGTPVYMPPEQLVGKTADARSDLYAFCVALYEGLYGSRPFEGATLSAQLEAKASEAVLPAPHDRRVPVRIRHVLLTGLRADPAARPATMDDLLRALDRAARRPRVWAVPVGAVLALGVAAVVGAAATRAPAHTEGPSKDAIAGVVQTLAGPNARIACPIFEARGAGDVATKLGAAAASLACARVQWEIGGRGDRILPPAALLDVPRQPADGFVDPYVAADARQRSLDAARARAPAYVDGVVTLEHDAWTVDVAVRTPDGRPVSEAHATGPDFLPAMKSALDGLWKAPLVPQKIDVEVARWTGFPNAEFGRLEVDLWALEVREDACAGLARLTPSDAGPVATERVCEKSYSPAAIERRPPSVDYSSPEALVSSFFAVMRWDEAIGADTAKGLARRAEVFLEAERSPIGRSRLAHAAALLWTFAGERERAEPLLLLSLRDDPLSEQAWELASRRSGGEAGARNASAVAEAWFPSETQLAPEATSRRSDELEARLRATELAFRLRAKLLPAIRYGIALAEKGRSDDARAVAATPLASADEREKLALIVLAFVDLHDARIGRAIGRLEEAGTLVMVDLASLAEAAGRADEVATRWARKFLQLPDDEAGPIARNYDTPMVFCMRAGEHLANACLDRLERLGHAQFNWWYQGGEPLLPGARLYARGDVRGAAAAWRPLVAASEDTIARILPTDAFERAGERTLAARLDARKLPFAFIAGLSGAAPREAERALAFGDTARAKSLARAVIRAWEVADIDMPAVARMRSLAGSDR
jgi:tRNA A-37 threonylcarbamoyl transferase component Bud32